ncbi:MAG: TetR/AcrR family transcriptional regulator [Labilithrix sp.]|nr:TetR/AcrR family transcriptional regulator [Labilithrix sp.]
MKTPNQVRRADSRRNRQRLIDAAEAVIGRDGAGASLEEIARLAGVGSATLHRHFPSRHALLNAVFHEGVRRLGERALQLLDELAPQAALVRWLDELTTYTSTTRGLAMALLAEPEGQIADEDSCHGLIQDAATLLIDKAAQAGALRRKLLPRDPTRRARRPAPPAPLRRRTRPPRSQARGPRPSTLARPPPVRSWPTLPSPRAAPQRRHQQVGREPLGRNIPVLGDLSEERPLELGQRDAEHALGDVRVVVDHRADRALRHAEPLGEGLRARGAGGPPRPGRERASRRRGAGADPSPGAAGPKVHPSPGDKKA